ncbi:hypothetical protein CC78DRAFT_581143 [Lojkania enalia]|uniref:Uncharacterized protein n=1 Tax=Lojkania enalia TaxID=147567 RepID=A0A9P4N5T2_9PLEO|nr:hypothetical protein CC78DRAFT_581143 [Didymosphaeria enalia]
MSASKPFRPHFPDGMHPLLPTSLFNIDPRDPRSMSFASNRLGMEGPDYIGVVGMGPFGDRSQGSTFMPPEFEPEMMSNQQQIDELVRKTNLTVQLVNGQIAPSARYGQLQPKMCSDARFPEEFRVPRTIEEIKTMDPSSVDRILRAYGLPTDLRSLRLTSQDFVNSRMTRQAKLCILFDFLGATQISEREKMKRTGYLPY